MEKLMRKLPTLDDLVERSEDQQKQNALMVLLNQPPPEKWLKEHPMAKGVKYLPIERVEYLLSAIYITWRVEVRNVQVVANSVVATVRLHVVNPITETEEWQDGLGAAPIQTDKGAGACDWQKVKADGVMKAAPAAESYAVKDAAEKFGKIFGKDLNRKEAIIYDGLLREYAPAALPDDVRAAILDTADLRQLSEVVRLNGEWSGNPDFISLVKKHKEKIK